jgi:hypothetical protein
MTLNGKSITIEGLKHFWEKLHKKHRFNHWIKFKGTGGMDWWEDSGLSAELTHEIDDSGLECQEVDIFMSNFVFNNFYCKSCDTNIAVSIEDPDDFEIDSDIYKEINISANFLKHKERMLDGFIDKSSKS